MIKYYFKKYISYRIYMLVVILCLIAWGYVFINIDPGYFIMTLGLIMTGVLYFALNKVIEIVDSIEKDKNDQNNKRG